MVTEQVFIFPLSFEQQRLWFFHQLEPRLPLYNVPIACRLKGKLDVAMLEQSLNEIVRRHEALRTTFEMVDGQPMQVVHPTLLVKLPVRDLQMHPLAERETKILRLVEEEALHPFDLATGPLLRAQILRSGPEAFILILTMHHIVFDDRSMDIFYRELQTLYNTYREGEPSPLLELPIQYADYASWQREWQEKTFGPLLIYWKQQLKDAPAILELPTDRPRPPVQSYQGDLYYFDLSAELSQALNALSRQEGATLFMTLLTAFQILLARYSGQYDIVVGSPIINRNRVEIETIIGFFVNMLALRTDLTGNPTFCELLGRVRKMVLDGYTHLDLPFEKLVDGLQLRRDSSYSPLFQVMFALQNASSAELNLTGLSAIQFEKTSRTAKFDLSLIIATDSKMTTVIEYNTGLFDKETIARMAEHFRTLLEGIVAHPKFPLADLPLLTAAERQRFLVEWNATTTDYPCAVSLPQLFEEQVERTPHTIAVTFEQQTLTYREINTRANQLAHHLQRLGVGPEVTVGICVERSMEMLVGLLGILKAGGAYIPLDPTYPKERLAFILEDTQAPVLLTQERLVQELSLYQAHMICLDKDWDLIASESTDNPDNGAAAQNLAYVIYTSGSTGKPKGVMIVHQALMNFLYSMREQLTITSQDVMLATTSLSFDIAGLELYLPLLVGAQVVIASQEMVVDGKQLAVAIDNYEKPLLQMTPAAWGMLVRTGWQGNQKLRILCGGDALSLGLARELLTRGAYLVNLYGPTETTIWSTLHQISHTDSTISLGQPIANTQIYVLDASMQPVPSGMPGELYIGGAGLARGYFNRSDLTAEKFVPDPFTDEPGARLYRTGDLVRYRSHRTIELLGRIDNQVKIRGFRIELGEVEVALRGHYAVRDAIVIAHGDTPGDKRLVAYLIVDQEAAPSLSSLRDYLNTRLPGYMVPSVLMFLDAFPLTPNGKIDRKHFPSPSSSEADREYVAPRRPIEELLADIWEEVLDLEQVGIYDSLFDLGGDSLRSMQITARTQQVGLSITLKQLLRYQTIDLLVNDLTANQQSAAQIKKIESFLQAR